MSKRLQVVLDEAELEEIQRAADREEMTVSEWVRKALREARAKEPMRSEESKLQAVRVAAPRLPDRRYGPDALRDRARLPHRRQPLIFIDSNVPMYLVGAEHPNKATARRVLERLVASGEPMVTSAEVFQEILHRYVALRRLDAVGPAFAVLYGWPTAYSTSAPPTSSAPASG